MNPEQTNSRVVAVNELREVTVLGEAREVVPDVMKSPSRHSLHEERMDVRSHGLTLPFGLRKM